MMMEAAWWTLVLACDVTIRRPLKWRRNSLKAKIRFLCIVLEGCGSCLCVPLGILMKTVAFLGTFTQILFLFFFLYDALKKLDLLNTLFLFMSINTNKGFIYRLICMC